MKDINEFYLGMSRRHFLSKASLGIGTAALASLLPGCTGSRETLGLSSGLTGVFAQNSFLGGILCESNV